MKSLTGMYRAENQQAVQSEADKVQSEQETAASQIYILEPLRHVRTRPAEEALPGLSGAYQV